MASNEVPITLEWSDWEYFAVSGLGVNREKINTYDGVGALFFRVRIRLWAGVIALACDSWVDVDKL